MLKKNALTYAQESDSFVRKSIIQAIEASLGASKVSHLYYQAFHRVERGASWWDAALAELDVAYQLEHEHLLSQVPPRGPLLLVANHPFGVVDGLIASKLAHSFRTHFKVLVNSVLCSDPYFEPWFLPIDFSESPGANRRNVSSRRYAQEALERGEALILFPGGGVATRRGGIGAVCELPWGTLVARLALKTNATILPLFFSGQNSLLFHILSQLHMNLRLAMFVPETLRRSGKEHLVNVRPPFLPRDLKDFSSASQLTSALFERTMLGE